MPTRTVRLQASTFLEKLSKNNCFRKKHTHKQLDEMLAKYPEIRVKPGATIATKMEYLAAVNFLVYYGKNVAQLDALSDSALQTLNTMLNHPAESDRAELLSRITEFTQDLDQGDDFSEDSSGTDAGTQSGKTPEPPKKKKKLTKHVKSKALASQTPSDDDDGDESFSDDSNEDGTGLFGNEGKRTRKPKKSDRREKTKKCTDNDGGDYGDNESDADKASSASDFNVSDLDWGQSPEPHDPKTKNKPKKKSPATKEPSSPSSSGDDESEADKSSSDESPPKSQTGRLKKPESRTLPAHGSAPSNPEDSVTLPEQMARQKEKVKELRRQEKKKDSARSSTQHSKKTKTKHAADSDDDASSDSERAAVLDATRFLEINKSFAASAIAACGCAMCRMYKHLKKCSSKDVIRAARKYVGTFRKPSDKAKLAGLREWAAMLFWCRHRPADQSWRNLRSSEQQYIATCLVTPALWATKVRKRFAKST